MIQQLAMQTYQQCGLHSMCKDTTTEEDDQFTNDSNVQTIQSPVTHHTTLFINISNRMTIKWGLLLINSNVLYGLLSPFKGHIFARLFPIL